MTPGQIKYRKQAFLKKLKDGDVTPTYEIRLKRLRDERLYTDERQRVQ